MNFSYLGLEPGCNHLPITARFGINPVIRGVMQDARRQGFSDCLFVEP